MMREKHTAGAIEWEVPVWTTVDEQVVGRVIIDNDVRAACGRSVADSTVDGGLFQDCGRHAKQGHAFPSYGGGCRVRHVAGCRTAFLSVK